MPESKTERKWRRNAAAVVVDKAGRVLLCKSRGTRGYWHFPQGGVNAGEEVKLAVMREVREEIGLLPDCYTIEDRLDGLRYTYREGHPKSHKWIGQQQTYFLLRCKTEKPRIKLSMAKEFGQFQWIRPRDICLVSFTPSKRKVVEKVLTHFLGIQPIHASSLRKFSVSELNSSLTPIMDYSQYLVKPGEKFRMDDHDPDDRSLFYGNKEESLTEFNLLREEMQYLQKLLYAENKRKVLVVIQAMDTGGKDGCIRHVFGWIDPQGINVVAFKKPTPEELGHDFLWRVHKAVPGSGQITIFNRSHYEDIVAVKVKKLQPEDVWKKRYQHIIDFERLLTDEGTTVLKFFLNISKEEQKARIESRLKDPNKFWKFHEDDLADRSQWGVFQNTYADVMARTSTDASPWFIIPANRKWYRNLIVARIFVDTLRKMNMQYPLVDFDPAQVFVGD